MTPAVDLAPVVPELILVGAGIVVLLAGVVLRRADPLALLFVAIAGVAGAAAASLMLWRWDGGLTVLGGAWALEMHTWFDLLVFKEQYLALLVTLALTAVFLGVKARRSEAVEPVEDVFLQGEVIVRGGTKLTELDAFRIATFGLDEAAPDLTGLAGWFVLSALLVTLLLGWVWRFRRDFWHRNNVLVLISVLVLFATLALQITAGRAALPFLMPLAAIPILLAVLLDAEVAVVVTAILAVVAGAVNRPSIAMAAETLIEQSAPRPEPIGRSRPSGSQWRARSCPVPGP